MCTSDKCNSLSTLSSDARRLKITIITIINVSAQCVGWAFLIIFFTDLERRSEHPVLWYGLCALVSIGLGGQTCARRGSRMKILTQLRSSSQELIFDCVTAYSEGWRLHMITTSAVIFVADIKDVLFARNSKGATTHAVIRLNKQSDIYVFIANQDEYDNLQAFLDSAGVDWRKKRALGIMWRFAIEYAILASLIFVGSLLFLR
jgi:hypothetical protein